MVLGGSWWFFAVIGGSLQFLVVLGGSWWTKGKCREDIGTQFPNLGANILLMAPTLYMAPWKQACNSFSLCRNTDPLYDGF